MRGLFLTGGIPDRDVAGFLAGWTLLVFGDTISARIPFSSIIIILLRIEE